MIYAGFWVRFGAFLIDVLILILPGMVANMILPIVGGFIVPFLYFPVFHSSVLMATPGKAFMGLAVVNQSSGSKLTFKKALIRYLSTYISSFILMIGYLLNLITEKRQTLHDLIAESVVIEKEPEDINYFTVWLNEIKKIFSELSGENKENKSNDFIAPVAANPMSSDVTHPESKSETVAEITKAIEELHKLLQSGAITQEEFEAKKSQLLNKI